MPLNFKSDDSTQLPYVEIGGERRILACLPPLPENPFPKFSAAPGVKKIARADWREVDYSVYGMRILDQNGQGSCVGHGSCTAFECARAITGATVQALSPCFIYGLINGNRDNGAVVSEALQALQSTGVCLESEVGPKHIWKRDFPQTAFTTSKRFRVSAAYGCDDFDEIATALILGFSVSFGIQIGRHFEPNHDGYIPDQSGSGGGHCMAAVGLKKGPNGSWYLKVQNSWSKAWGLNGFCFIPESYFSNYVDAFAIQAAKEDPDDASHRVPTKPDEVRIAA